jgi:ATP-binding cassette subfamily C protein
MWSVKALLPKQTDLMQIIQLITKTDRIKLIYVTLIQVGLSFFDLLGVVFFGLIGSISVSAISSTEISGRTESAIIFLGIDNYSSQTQVIILAIIASAFMIFKTITSLYFNKKIFFFLARRSALITKNLSSSLFNKSFTVIKAQETQKLIYTLTEGVDQLIIRALATAVILIADLSLLLVLTLGLMAINFTLTSTILVMLGLVATVLYFLIRKKNEQVGTLKADHTITSSRKIFETLSNYRELFLRGQRQTFVEEIGKFRLFQVEAMASANYLTNFNKYILEASVLIVTLLIAGIQFLMSDALESVATLTLFFAAISRIAPAVFRIQQNLLIIKNALGSARPTFELISKLNLSIDEQESELSMSAIPSSHRGFVNHIKVSNLKFKYSGSDKFAVDDISIELKSGQHIAVVGPSGSGKSTFVDLLLGLHHPSSGSVEIGGVQVLEAVKKWPGAISYVPQEIELISGSIIDNVLLGFESSQINEIEVLRALRNAELNEYINAGGAITGTNIGNDGGKLSGGQRQRIGIARALLTNPKILVMDEATSALDAQTEDNISNTIKKIKETCLVIVVAHRLATVRKADLIIYLQDGQIIAKGNFDQVRAIVPDFDIQAQLMGL